MDLDLYNTHDVVVLDGARSVTANANRTGVDLQQYIGVGIVTLGALNVSGTTPTLDVKLQDSPDNSTFTDISGAAFTQVTTTGSDQKFSLNLDAIARYVRVVDAVGGTTPVTIRTVKLLARKQVI